MNYLLSISIYSLYKADLIFTNDKKQFFLKGV